jgi:hypothetical protein
MNCDFAGMIIGLRTHYGPWQPCWISDQRQKQNLVYDHPMNISAMFGSNQMNCDFAGMIIGWSCTKLVNRLLIGNSRWPQ